VLDDRPGSHAEVSFARPGPLRLYVHVHASTDAADLTGLRVLLVADLLFRAAEVGGLQVLATRVFTGEAAAQAAMERAADALGVNPPALPAAPGVAWPGGQSGVHVADETAVNEDDHSGILVRTAAARMTGHAFRDGATAGLPAGLDPLAVRFALMSVPRQQPAEITAATLGDAARTLNEWRHRVAGWAEFPSHRIPEPVQAAFMSAFSSLDAVAVLSSLSRLMADETMPPGARFEASVYADRVLGLDLPRDIGR